MHVEPHVRAPAVIGIVVAVGLVALGALGWAQRGDGEGEAVVGPFSAEAAPVSSAAAPAAPAAPAAKPRSDGAASGEAAADEPAWTAAAGAVEPVRTADGLPLGLWTGNMGGHLTTVLLDGTADAISGKVTSVFEGESEGDRGVEQATTAYGTYDPANRTLERNDDPTGRPDAGEYVLTLGPDGTQLSGSIVGSHQETSGFLRRTK